MQSSPEHERVRAAVRRAYADISALAGLPLPANLEISEEHVTCRITQVTEFSLSRGTEPAAPSAFSRWSAEDDSAAAEISARARLNTSDEELKKAILQLTRRDRWRIPLNGITGKLSLSGPTSSYLQDCQSCIGGWVRCLNFAGPCESDPWHVTQTVCRQCNGSGYVDRLVGTNGQVQDYAVIGARQRTVRFPCPRTVTSRVSNPNYCNACRGTGTVRCPLCRGRKLLKGIRAIWCYSARHKTDHEQSPTLLFDAHSLALNRYDLKSITASGGTSGLRLLSISQIPYWRGNVINNETTAYFEVYGSCVRFRPFLDKHLIRLIRDPATYDWLYIPRKLQKIPNTPLERRLLLAPNGKSFERLRERMRGSISDEILQEARRDIRTAASNVINFWRQPRY